MAEPIKTWSMPSSQLLGDVLCGDIVLHVLAPATLLFTLLIIIDSLLPQIEMFITHGNIPVPMSVVKLILVLCAFLAWAVRSRIDLSWFALSPWMAFVVYLVFDIPHLLGQNLSLFKVLSAYYGYYSLVFLLPVLGAVSRTIRSQTVLNVLFVSFAFCAALGILQRLTDSPIVYPMSNDGSFAVITWRFFATHEIRIFSFFVYSVNFGLFCTLVGSAALHQALHRRHTARGVIIYCTAALCSYLTLTRVVYLAFLLGTVCVFVLRYVHSLRILRAIPGVGFLLGLVVAYGGALGWFGSGSGIGDNVSLIMRVEQFVYYWNMFMSGDLGQRLLGIGYVQDTNVNGEAIYPIDNLFMALLLHIGIVGMVLLLFLFWMLWNRLSYAAMRQQHSLTAGVCGVWAAYLAISVFDISLAFFPCCMMLLVWSGLLLKTEGKMERSDLGM